MVAVREIERVDLHDEPGVGDIGALQRIGGTAEALRVDVDFNVPGGLRRDREADDAYGVGDLLAVGEIAVEGDLRRLRIA
jgi:hypothetical protein